MIEFSDFSKSYKTSFSKKSLFSVENISFKVEDSSVTGLIGANGSGKTTIIKAACAFHYPDRGSIYITGKDGKKIDITLQPEKAMEEIGYVPEKTLLPPDMTVKEFLHYCASLHSLCGEQETNSIKKVISDCSLEDVLDKKIKQLSKGYGQRLSFAQALIHNPQNLILDEPFSGLDPSQIISIRKLIERLSAEKAVLLSTHILSEVSSLCSKMCIMKLGQLAATGTEAQIIEQTSAPSFEAAFLKLTEKGSQK